MSRRLPGLGLMLSCLLLGGATAAQQAPLPEASIKAAFLLRFADYVEWPPAASTRPLTVCLSRSHQFGPTVATLAEQTRSKGRAVVVRGLDPATPGTGCDIAYLEADDYMLLDPLSKLPVLTVGDAPGFCHKGGIINFRTIRGRVRFEIGLDNARRAGLSIHAQLLQLATVVYGGRQ